LNFKLTPAGKLIPTALEGPQRWRSYLSARRSVRFVWMEGAWNASFWPRKLEVQKNSPPRLRRGCGAQRHRGGASCSNPATDSAFPCLFEPLPPWPVAAASPPCPRRGTLLPCFTDTL